MKKTLLVAACSFALEASSKNFVLIPEGIFKGVDGRPFDAPHWNLTPECGKQIVATLNQRAIDMVMDYEHATLKAQESGDPAPAAGWLKPLGFQYVEGVGICSTQFEWTEKAKGFIESKEYKYISPVLFYNKAGEVIGLHSVALTNTPNLDRLPEARLAAAAQDFLSQINDEDSTMNEFLKLMLKKLGLSDTATEQEVIAAANSAFLKLDGAFGTSLATTTQTLEQAVDKAVEVKTAANNQSPDPSKFVPIAMYSEAKAQAAQVAANGQAVELENLITAACSDGRLTGDTAVNWAKEFAKRDPEGLKAHLSGIPKIAALTQQQTTTLDLKSAANHQQHPIDDITASIAAQMGLEVKELGASA